MNFEVKIILNEENFRNILKDLGYYIAYNNKVYNDSGDFTGIQIFSNCLTIELGGYSYNWTVFTYSNDNYIKKSLGLNKSYFIGNETSYFSLSKKYTDL